MSGTFQALMALSASQTKEAQSAVQTALAQRQRNEELKRKKQAEQEEKEREMARKLRLKHFEDERRERERQKQIEEARQAREAALQKREEEARDALRYGPKKAKALSSTSGGSSPKWPSSSSQSRVQAEVRKGRLPDDADDDSAPEFLTREEKRERKQQQERRKLFQSSKRSSNMGGYSKPGKRLPGGAVDVTITPQAADSVTTKSVKERIAAMPNTLTKLNTVKRDTRTIDEILQDRAKARETKVLDGDEAREFNDWFGSSKKKETAKKSSTQPTVSATNSGANTPASQGSNARGSTPQPSSVNLIKKANTPSKPSFSKTISAKGTGSTSSGPKPIPSSRSTHSEKRGSSTPATSTKPSKTPVGSKVTTNGRSNMPQTKKRPRSPSLSDSPPPSKKHTSRLGDTIWQLFGRDRNNYVGMDVLSDDEDMEADATILEKEEKISARIAKKEDTIALEEERRHEEEKRRRKREKEAREWRN